MKTILGMIMDGRKAYHGGNMHVYVIHFHESIIILPGFEHF